MASKAFISPITHYTASSVMKVMDLAKTHSFCTEENKARLLLEFALLRNKKKKKKCEPVNTFSGQYLMLGPIILKVF